jgi:hypothetical protein
MLHDEEPVISGAPPGRAGGNVLGIGERKEHANQSELHCRHRARFPVPRAVVWDLEGQRLKSL